MLIRRSGQRLHVQTPAKLNLFLEITEKRSDGYHELETAMVSVDLYDSLVFKEDESGRIRLLSPEVAQRRSTGLESLCDVPADSRNLVVRAAEVLREHAGVGFGASIRLIKRIPVAAGMGGGSSDAAATLVALNRLWKLNLGVGELLTLAAKIGSDVGYFVVSVPAALCRGRGEIVEPVPLATGLHFVVVRPPNGLSTAQVFSRSRVPPRPVPAGSMVDAMSRGSLREVAHRLHNRLEGPACELTSVLRRLKTQFEKLPLLGHSMTGSGTTWFGLCHSRRQAVCLAACLRARQSGLVLVASSRI